MIIVQLDSMIVNTLTKDVVQTASKNIKTSVSDVSSVTECRGIMLSEYRNRLDKIAHLLFLYKLLLKKDMSDIQKRYSEFDLIDSDIADIFDGFGGGGGGGGGFR